ncbi:MAG: hypothetical protein AVDCRST_MAG69-1393, partial [uncultured Solirubrobacteraceae bacterium]
EHGDPVRAPRVLPVRRGAHEPGAGPRRAAVRAAGSRHHLRRRPSSPLPGPDTGGGAGWGGDLRLPGRRGGPRRQARRRLVPPGERDRV